ncbi:hypothetical protein RQP46_001371 [Phenoliferia psychrophenolica]
MGKMQAEDLVVREVDMKRAQNAIPLESYATAVAGQHRSNAPSGQPSRTSSEIITQPEPAHHRGALPHPPSSSSRPAKGYSEHERPGRSAQVVDGAESLAARRSHTRRERRVEPTRKAAKYGEEEEEDEIVDDSEEDRDSTAASAKGRRRLAPFAKLVGLVVVSLANSLPLTSDAIAKDKATRKEAKHRKLVVEKWTNIRQHHGDLAVAREFKQRQHDIEALERTRAELGDHWNQAQRRQVDLAGDLARRAKVVEDLEHQLSSSRAFVESSDLSSTALSQSLIALSSQLKSIAYTITTSLMSPSLPREMRLSGEHLVAISQALADSGPHGARLLEFAIEIEERESFVLNWIYGALMETLAVGIWKGVLGRFHPALSAKQDVILRRLYKIVRTTEPQDRSARWRSITYSRAAPSAPSPTHTLTNTLLSQIFIILSALVPSTSFDLSPHAPPIAALIDAALAWHRTAMVDVLSRDFVGIIYDGSEKRTAEVVGGFGLKVRSGDGGKEGKGMEKVVVRVPMMRL